MPLCSIIFDPSDDTCFFTGTARGSIVRVSTADGSFTEWAYVGGRPLGGSFDKDGNLIVCEPSKGLIKVDRNTVSACAAKFFLAVDS